MISSELYSVEKVTNNIKLHFALGVRAIVFIEEQSCPFYEEFDKYDTLNSNLAIHYLLLKKEDNEPIATARVIATNKGYVKLGRLALLKKYRGKKIGSLFLKELLLKIKQGGEKEVKIHAQAHLEEFYGSFGFKKSSKPFDEAGIPHIEMRCKF